jgi:hypothetical protein
MMRLIKCAALLLLLGTAACEDGVAPPEPGTALVNLGTTATDAGAVLITMTGPGITNIKPANSSYEVFWRLASDTEMRILVVGAITPGPLLTAEVSDVGRLDSYMTELVEVAGRDGALKAGDPPFVLTTKRLAGR